MRKMTWREIIQRIVKDGWYTLPRTATSHQRYRHPAKKGMVVISAHRKSDIVPTGTLKSILAQAQLTGEEEL